MTGSFLCAILKITLLLSTSSRVSTDDLSEHSEDTPSSFNKTLILYNEATDNLNNLTGSISELTEEIEDTIKLKNEVECQVCGKMTYRPFLEAVSVWLSWMMANSLCDGDLNMTAADTLWKQSR